MFLALAVAPTLGCGSDDVELTDGGDVNPDEDGGGTGTEDSGTPLPDGGFGGDCTADGPQCNNCLDDDGDGKIDGADVECTSSQDNDEGSFATGIPGDNKDLKWQDCFFDGDSGQGNDGCNVHVCCIAETLCEGPESIDNSFDAATDCTVSDKCKSECGAVTPPGCDCLGCCTICGQVDGVDGCADVAIHPLLYPEECSDADPSNDPDTCCDADHLENCVACEFLEDCGDAGCVVDKTDCILCPGETDEDLGPDCTDNECADGQQSCNISEDCGESQYCSAGCCIEGGIG